MSLSLDTLREKNAVLLDLYRDHINVIKELQKKLLEKKEEGKELYSDPWIEDTESLFRLLKREDFDIEELPAAADSVLEWRAQQNFQDSSDEDEDAKDIELMRCLSPPAKDHLGRPVVLVKLSNVQGTAEELKRYVIIRFEELRVKIKALNDESDNGEPILQYALIIDIANAGGMTLASDLGPWLVKNIPPNYHGITGSIYFVNYSMFYSGIWALAKRIVPQYILDKISFVTPSELLDLIPIFGTGEQQRGFRFGHGFEYRLDQGSRPASPIASTSTTQYNNNFKTNPNGTPSSSSPAPASSSTQPKYQPHHPKRPAVLSRTSSQNPFFGYRFALPPYSPYSTSPTSTYTINHIGNIYQYHFFDAEGNRVSRRKRIGDLIWTLLRMYYRRWKGRLLVLFGVIVGWILLRRKRKRVGLGSIAYGGGEAWWKIVRR